MLRAFEPDVNAYRLIRAAPAPIETTRNRSCAPTVDTLHRHRVSTTATRSGDAFKPNQLPAKALGRRQQTEPRQHFDTKKM
jgi:hypothetical protein